MAAPKKGQFSGFLKGMNFMARMNEVAFLSFVQKSIDNKEYEKLGYDTVREFVKEELGIHYDTFRDRINAIQKLGPEITGILVDMGLHMRDVKMIEQMMTEEQKASLKKGVLEHGDRKIPIDADHAEDIRIAFANIKEQAETAEKAVKTAKREAASIKKEYDAGNAPLKKELDRLKAIMEPDTPEKLIAAFEALDKMLGDFDTALRTLVWKSPWVKDDPATQAKVEALQTRAEKRFASFREDWDGFCNGGE